jgi:Amylo-alpha-1,6-glucosidase
VGLDLGPKMERAMREVARRQLAGRQGIRTLAPEDWPRVFSPEFLGDRRLVRGRRMRSVGKFNYHRGVEWNWLARFFVQAELKYGEPDTAYRRYLRSQVEAALHLAGIGGISELFDFSGARGPEFQAWSMAGFLEAIHAFAGVHIDVPARRIVIEPQLPAEWPRIDARKWYGAIPFDVHFTGDQQSRTLCLEFSGTEIPDADFDVALTVPARHTANSLDVRLDGLHHPQDWIVEPLPGTRKRRVKFCFPARRRVEIALGLSTRRAGGSSRTTLTPR